MRGMGQVRLGQGEKMGQEFEGFRYAYEIDLDQDTTAAKVVRLVGTGKNVLEFGCGPGHMSRVLVERMRCKVTGIELDSEAASHAERYCQRVYNIDLDNVDILEIVENDEFDVLLFADILEHLKHPQKVLHAAYEILDKRGYVVASVPNVGYCGLVGELLCGKFQYRELGLLDETHIRFFTRQSLTSMFEENGFEIGEMDTFELPVEFSEFKGVTDHLPEAVWDFLLSCKDSMVYQFVLKAYKRKRSGLITKLTDYFGLRQGE